VNAFDVLGDPIRRRILELLSDGEVSAGELATTISREFAITQPGVSAHLRVLRESGFATVRPDGARRLYAIDGTPLAEAEEWIARFRSFWSGRLEALDTEIARGRKRAGTDERRSP
jgi:DNA-binding transcriptional ArsR family regulator